MEVFASVGFLLIRTRYTWRASLVTAWRVMTCVVARLRVVWLGVFVGWGGEKKLRGLDAGCVVLNIVIWPVL
jgi:hypothetical protein